MKTIRNNVFETNSSSIHSFTICDDEEYKNFKKDKALYYNEQIISLEKLHKLYCKESKKKIDFDDFKYIVICIADMRHDCYFVDWDNDYAEDYEEICKLIHLYDEETIKSIYDWCAEGLICTYKNLGCGIFNEFEGKRKLGDTIVHVLGFEGMQG